MTSNDTLSRLLLRFVDDERRFTRMAVAASGAGVCLIALLLILR
jgi:hypothetical protein